METPIVGTKAGSSMLSVPQVAIFRGKIKVDYHSILYNIRNGYIPKNTMYFIDSSTVILHGRNRRFAGSGKDDIKCDFGMRLFLA